MKFSSSYNIPKQLPVQSKKSPWKFNSSHDFFLWLLLGILCSLFLHFFLLQKIGNIPIAAFNPVSYDTVIPRRFHLERAEIDPKLLEETQKKEDQSLLKPVGVTLSGSMNVSSQEEIIKSEFVEKPSNIMVEEFSNEKPESGLDKELIPTTIARPDQPQLVLDQSVSSSTTMGDLINNQKNVSGKNYSQLDELIKNAMPVSSKTAPILLPTDLLFEYDSEHLKSGAEESLSKLAMLIQRNPKAHFLIEGYTDSFGSDSYNLDLSTRRSESVKQWLITKQLVNSQQIESRGLGKSHFIVRSTGTIEQQKLNRRVEIVIKT